MHCGRLGSADDDSGKEFNRFFKTFFVCHIAVFVLDGDNSVVAAKLKLGNKLAPIFFAVAVAYCAENPGTVKLIAVMRITAMSFTVPGFSAQ